MRIVKLWVRRNGTGERIPLYIKVTFFSGRGMCAWRGESSALYCAHFEVGCSASTDYQRTKHVRAAVGVRGRVACARAWKTDPYYVEAACCMCIRYKTTSEPTELDFGHMKSELNTRSTSACGQLVHAILITLSSCLTRRLWVCLHLADTNFGRGTRKHRF